MSCDRCGLDLFGECQCHVWELEKRISALEEGYDQLTYIVKSISDFIKEKKNAMEEL